MKYNADMLIIIHAGWHNGSHLAASSFFLSPTCLSPKHCDVWHCSATGHHFVCVNWIAATCQADPCQVQNGETMLSVILQLLSFCLTLFLLFLMVTKRGCLNWIWNCHGKPKNLLAIKQGQITFSVTRWGLKSWNYTQGNGAYGMSHTFG